MGAFIKLLALAIISIIVLVLAGLAYEWLRNRLGIKPQPAQPQPAAPTPALALGVYVDVGYCVTECVNSSKTSGLTSTQNPAQNHVPINQRVRGTSNKPILIYEFQRNIVGPIVIKAGKTIRSYDSTPLSQIVEILNRSLEGHCIYNGCFPVVIVDARDIGDGRVRLAVAEKPVNF